MTEIKRKLKADYTIHVDDEQVQLTGFISTDDLIFTLRLFRDLGYGMIHAPITRDIVMYKREDKNENA